MKQMLDFVTGYPSWESPHTLSNSVEKQENCRSDGTTTGTEDKFQDLYSFTIDHYSVYV